MLGIVNLVVTIISIVATFCSMKHARKAKEYKEETLLLTNTFDLECFVFKFQTESEAFLAKTRKSQWDKGVDPSIIISPFKVVLSSFGRVYHLVNNQDVLKTKVYQLNEIVQTYHTAKAENKKQANNLIFEITDILQQEVIRNRDKITAFS